MAVLLRRHIWFLCLNSPLPRRLQRSCFGLPQDVISDRGHQFFTFFGRSSANQSGPRLASLLSVKWSNGALQPVTGGRGSVAWYLKTLPLSIGLSILITLPVSATGLSPFQCVFRYQPPARLLCHPLRHCCHLMQCYGHLTALQLLTTVWDRRSGCPLRDTTLKPQASSWRPGPVLLVPTLGETE